MRSVHLPSRPLQANVAKPEGEEVEERMHDVSEPVLSHWSKAVASSQSLSPQRSALAWFPEVRQKRRNRRVEFSRKDSTQSLGLQVPSQVRWLETLLCRF